MVLVRNSIKNQKRDLTVILILRRGHRRQWFASRLFVYFCSLWTEVDLSDNAIS